MWNNLLYGILLVWVKAHAILPMKVLYIFSDIFYLVIYRLVGYRVKVVRENLKNSFPDKTEKELRQIERDFYHHFSDYIMETIKLAHLPFEEALQRAVIKNPEVIYNLVEQGHSSLVLMMGHYGNWEWYTHADRSLKYVSLYQIYRPLTNKAFDRLFIYLRTRYGAKGIRKNDTIRDLIRIKRDGEKAAVIFLSDQTPSWNNLHYWTNFLNQKTPMLTGAERIASKQKLPVIFLDVQKVKRGYYTMDLILLNDKPQEMQEFELTEKYTRLLERMILRQPAYWLWTHKRWKYKDQAP